MNYIAIKRINLIDALGLGTDESPDAVLNRVNRDIANLNTRLGSQGVDTGPPGEDISLLTKTLRTLGIPLAAVNSSLREVVDKEPGFNVKRAFNRDTLWRKQTQPNDVLEVMGLRPENKIARFATNFAGSVLLDPLTYLSGGITGALKVGVPFGKATQVTSKGLGQVAKVVPYLDDGRVVAKTIPDAWTRLFKGKETLSPAVTTADAIRDLTKTLNLTNDEATALTKRFEGVDEAQKAAKAKKPKWTPKVTGVQVGSKVRPLDRRNLGTITNIDEATETATVHFYNKADGREATKAFKLADLRDGLGNRVALPSKLPAQPVSPVAPVVTGDRKTDLLARQVQKMLRPEAKILTPGPLKPVADFVGPMFSTTYGKDPRLVSAYRALESNLRQLGVSIPKTVFDISRKHGLTEVEDNLLRRLAEEPEIREAVGVLTSLTPTSDLSRFTPELQDAIMKALPELSGGKVRPEVVQAFNEFQNVTRTLANIPEVERGWLKAKGAEGSGVEMLENYLKHEKVGVDPAQFAAKKLGTVQDPSLLPREQGTIEELNKVGFDFEKRMSVATAARALKAQYAVQSYDWVKQQLANPEWARVFDERYIDELLQAQGVVGEQAAKRKESLLAMRGGDTFENGMRVWEGGGKLKELGRHIVTPDMYEMLTTIDKRYMNLGDEGIKNFVDAIDWMTGKWKPLVTLRNPAFHWNNAIGNLWLMYLGDMNPLSMPTRLRQGADAILGKQGNVAIGNLGTFSLDELKEIALESGAIGHPSLWEQSGVKGLRESLAKLSGTQRKNALKRAGEWYDDNMRRLGNVVEDGSKMALFLDQMSKLTPNAEILAQSGKEVALWEMAQRAAMHVKKYLFDYGDLTNTEKQIFRRLAPFYSWARKNLPLQITEILNQPGKFAKIRIAKESTERMSDEPDSPKPAYLNEAIRLPFTMGDEKSPIYFNPRLPPQDLSRIPFIGSGGTGRELLGMLNPVAKIPLEAATGLDFFRMKPIAKYPGQTTEIFGGARVPVQLPFFVNEAVGVAGKTGAALQAFAPDAKATDTLRLIRTIFPGLYSFDPQQERVNAAYGEAERLRDLLRKFEDDTGRQVPTKRELRQMGLR